MGMESLAVYAAWIVGIGAAITVLYKAYRNATAKIRNVTRKISETADSLLGREEIRHPDTGEVIVEATPNLGTRLARIEGAVVQLADTSLAVVGLSNRVDAVEKRLDQHVTDCTTSKEEAAEMWKAIRAIAESAPVDPEEGC